MFAESIPSTVLQTYALLGSSKVTERAVRSIVISAASIAYSTTMITMSYDTDPAKRLRVPTYYGFVPDEGRMFVMIFMVLVATCHVLMKVLACSLMLRVNKTWFTLYLSGDMVIYYLYKIARGDLRYWMDVPNALSWFIPVNIRGMVKTLTDFTLLMQFRRKYFRIRPIRMKREIEGSFSFILKYLLFISLILTPSLPILSPPSFLINMIDPFELGGMYWSVNLVLNQVFCFITVYLYNTYSEENNLYELSGAASPSPSPHDGSPSAISQTAIPTFAPSIQESPSSLPLLEIVIGLFLVSMTSFGIFLRLINQEYIKTFYDTRTGSQFLCDIWRDTKSDKARFAAVFSMNKYLYTSINKELKEWLSANWGKWNDEGSDWFTATKISKVPSYLLPVDALKVMGGIDGRKASIAKMKEEAKKPAKDRERRGSDLKIIPMG